MREVSGSCGESERPGRLLVKLRSIRSACLINLNVTMLSDGLRRFALEVDMRIPLRTEVHVRHV